MKRKRWKMIALAFVWCLVLCGCGRSARQPISREKPNASVTYEKGRDFVGVLKAADQQNKRLTFYNTAFEEEIVCQYSGGTEILTKNGKEISLESLEVGQVMDVYQDEDTKKVEKIQLSADILEYEDVKDLVINADEGYVETGGVRYRYGSGFTVFSNGTPIDIKEITSLDEVTFRGVKGKAYSLVLTKGHGYLKPKKYKDFVGGTLTVNGVMIIPVTKKMLVPVPEGSYDVTMKNGDYIGSQNVTIERDKQAVLDMSLFKSVVANRGQVEFDIHPIGAELYINGTLTDYSKPVSLKYGKHSVKVVLDGYTTYTGVIDVQSANPTVEINLADEKAAVDDDSDAADASGDSDEQSADSAKYDNKHKITVTEPLGASLYMDGNYQGTIPCSFPKKIGNLTFTLSMKGYTAKSYTMTTTDDSQDVQFAFPKLASSAVG